MGPVSYDVTGSPTSRVSGGTGEVGPVVLAVETEGLAQPCRSSREVAVARAAASGPRHVEAVDDLAGAQQHRAGAPSGPVTTLQQWCIP